MLRLYSVLIENVNYQYSLSPLSHLFNTVVLDLLRRNRTILVIVHDPIMDRVTHVIAAAKNSYIRVLKYNCN